MKPTTQSVVREVGAGIVGFVLFNAASVLLFMVSGYDPYEPVSTAFRIGSIAAGVAFAFIAGYITAAISPASPIRPAIMVALLIAVMATISMLVAGSAETWSQLAALFLMAPAVALGAQVRRRRIRNSVQQAGGASPNGN